MSSKPHFTTRRNFIAAMGFSGISLYALWAAYGATPGPLALLGLAGNHAPSPSLAGGGHDGHGGAADGLGVDEFRRLSAEFVERYRMPDGSVYPRRLAPLLAKNDHSEHGMTPAAGHDDGHGDSHGAATDAPPTADDVIDVYLLAQKWYYQPALLRLDAGARYRFRMLAGDVSHGASIQFGRGGRMIRLRPNTVTEMEVSFDRPGRYFVYCTVYCGPLHDVMQARIDVV